jgi:hypothetical protein
MAINPNNYHAYGDVTQRVLTWPLGSAAPTSPLVANAPTGGYDVGWLDDDSGLTENSDLTTDNKFGWQGSSLVRVLKSKATKSFTFQCLEENAVVLGLLRPASTPTTTGATAEVQTMTITGAPTGGTFTVAHPAIGSVTFAYNVPTATMATSLSNLVGGTVTVTGTAGTSYVITFPSSLGNTQQAQVAATFTGGTTPAISIATTTPGVNGTTTWDVMPYTGINARQWGIYLVDGSVHTCKYIPNGEAVGTGSPVYKGSDGTIYEFTVNCYIDALGRFYRDITDNPAVGSGLFL